MTGRLMTGRLGVGIPVLALLVTSPVAAAPKPSPSATARPLAVRLADSVLARWPDPTTISGKGFEYTDGIVLRGLAEVYGKTRDPRYLAYIRRWVDAYLREDGSRRDARSESGRRYGAGGSRPPSPRARNSRTSDATYVDLGADALGHNLDRIQPGGLLLLLYQETRDPRYARAAHWLRQRFDSFPRNQDGGFWHKQKYPDEMWLDGIYMAEPFLVRYGKLFGEGGFPYDTAARQATLVAEHTRVPGTGLFRHAWDQDRNTAWADPKTGVSPEVWGRAMGWFLMALVDMIEDFPSEHPGRVRIAELLREAAGGVRATQDAKSGLWYQVLDQGSHPDNWLETSASAMFVYALRRGVERGHLEPAYAEVAGKGWRGLLTRVSDDAQGRPLVEGAVEGMSVQRDLAGYLSRRRLINSPHGVCAMLLAASSME